MGKNAPFRPAWTANLGAHRDSGVKCKGWCDTCGKNKLVDLVALAEYKGDDYVLWGRRTPCKLTEGCKGRVRFFQNGHGGFFNIMCEPGGWPD